MEQTHQEYAFKVDNEEGTIAWIAVMNFTNYELIPILF